MLDRGNGQCQHAHCQPGPFAPDARDAGAAPTVRAAAARPAHAARAARAAIEPLEPRRLLAIVGLLGDIQGGTNANAVANVVKGWNPQYIVSVGDNYYEADGVIDNTIGQYYHDYVSPYNGAWGAGSPSGNRFWSAIGNHEYAHSPGAADYFNFFAFPGNERYYRKSIDDVDWFFINSNPEEPDGNTANQVGTVQYNWLQSEMATSTATWKFVVFHHPPYTSSDTADATHMRWPFKDWGASAVFSGHNHLYERLNVNGLPYFISGLGGASIQSFGTVDPNSQFRFDARHGAMRLNIQPASVTFEFFDRLGALIDSSTILAPAGPAAPTNLVAGAVSSSRVDVSWTDNATTETGYVLERSPNGTSNWAQVAALAADATGYIDADPALQAGLTYHYRVRAHAGNTPSANSNIASATTLQPGYVNWIARGHTWKYLDTGVNQGTLWRPTAFDDSTWSDGRGQFGYGDGDETTIVSFGANAAAKYPTTYFRKTFTVANPAQVTQLDLSMLRDDGAVVYLNGAEIWRSNMPPTGTITFNTFAASPQGGAEESAWHGLAINPALLVTGNNSIAVEVHQDNAGSTDLSFDMVLTARLAAAIAPPSAFKAAAVAHNQVNLSWLDTTVGEQGFKIERSLNGTTWAEIGTAPAGATSYTDNTTSGNTQYWYRARAYNATGESRNSSVSTVTTAAAPDALPAGWTSADVGAVAAAGSATHNGGVFTVNGSGAGIAGTLDEFHFASRQWTGNGSVVARVNAITNTNSGAKFGVMFRESTAANSRHVMIGITPANQIVILARGASGNTSGPPVVSGVATPVWLKLIRNGDIFTAQYSTNGTTWSAPSSSSPIPMAATILVGLCVTSNLDGTLATGTFDSVSVTSSVTTSTGALGKTDPSNDKWKRVKTSMAEQVGLKEEVVDLPA